MENVLKYLKKEEETKRKDIKDTPHSGQSLQDRPL